MLNNNNISIYNFDKKIFQFKEIFNSFAVDNIGLKLEEIHNTDIKDLVPNEILKTGDDAKQPFCELFYNIDDEFDCFDKNTNKKLIKKNEFMKAYKLLMYELQENLFKEKIIFQKKPTIRVHLPNNVSTGTYHRDSEYGHSKNEINFWLPLTDAKKTATLHIEDSYMSEIYSPIDLKYGQILIFNSLLKHGTEINRENYTRVSFDFRIMKLTEYEETNKKSLVRKKKFKIGSYYDQF